MLEQGDCGFRVTCASRKQKAKNKKKTESLRLIGDGWGSVLLDDSKRVRLSCWVHDCQPNNLTADLSEMRPETWSILYLRATCGYVVCWNMYCCKLLFWNYVRGCGAQRRGGKPERGYRTLGQFLCRATRKNYQEQRNKCYQNEIQNGTRRVNSEHLCHPYKHWIEAFEYKFK